MFKGAALKGVALALGSVTAAEFNRWARPEAVLGPS
jgi:hypothetical protein